MTPVTNIKARNAAEPKVAILAALYDWYEQFVAGYTFACGPGCKVCCTTNVVLTGLEARYLLQSSQWTNNPAAMEALNQARKTTLYRPTATINQFAAACLARQEPPGDDATHVEGGCPLLDPAGRCIVYKYRPFACRAMSSTLTCRPGETAAMEPFLLTVNLALQQIIEYLDRDGVSGNLLDVVTALIDPDLELPVAFPENRPLPGFLVPPDEHGRFQDMLAELLAFPAANSCIGKYLSVTGEQRTEP